MHPSKKRKADDDDSGGERVKRSKGTDRPPQAPPGMSSATKDHEDTAPRPGPSRVTVEGSSNGPKGGEKGKAKSNKPAESTTSNAPAEKPNRKIKRLAAPRPFPTVPTSVSATGPRSAHKEGKNYICLTRKTPLGAYLRRCKEVIMADGCVVLLSLRQYLSMYRQI